MRLDQIKEEARLLYNLTVDMETGLSSWHSALRESLKRLHDCYVSWLKHDIVKGEVLTTEAVEKDFSELDFSAVDFNSGHWAWGGGDKKWMIYHVSSDLVRINYRLPECLNHMINSSYDHGEDMAKKIIQKALGI